MHGDPQSNNYRLNTIDASKCIYGKGLNGVWTCEVDKARAVSLEREKGTKGNSGCWREKPGARRREREREKEILGIGERKAGARRKERESE